MVSGYHVNGTSQKKQMCERNLRSLMIIVLELSDMIGCSLVEPQAYAGLTLRLCN